MSRNKPQDKKTASPVFESVPALAEYLGIGITKTYRALKKGVIPAIKIDSGYVLPRAAIDEWLRSAGADRRPTA